MHGYRRARFCCTTQVYLKYTQQSNLQVPNKTVTGLNKKSSVVAGLNPKDRLTPVDPIHDKLTLVNPQGLL